MKFIPVTVNLEDFDTQYDVAQTTSFNMYIPAGLPEAEENKLIHNAAVKVDADNALAVADYLGVANDIINEGGGISVNDDVHYHASKDDVEDLDIHYFDTPSYRAVKTSDGWGVIDAYGILIIPCENDKVYCTSADGYIVFEKDGKKGVYCIDYDICTAPEYDAIYDEGVGSYLRLTYDGKEGNLTIKGEFISDEQWDAMSEDDRDKYEFVFTDAC